MGVWEIVKVFMLIFGICKGDIVDVNMIDIGGFLNLLEWCFFINFLVNCVVLCLV